MSDFPAEALVLYKGRPAAVAEPGEKILLRLPDGETKRVRPKDIQLLHPGPAGDLTKLATPEGDLEGAREVLEGETATLADVADLAFGDHTPATAWAAWEAVADGLLFTGTPEAVTAIDGETVAAERQKRQEKAEAAAAREALLERLKKGEYAPEDAGALAEIERVALGTAAHSPLLRELDLAEEPEPAHRLLLRIDYWQPEHNPHPSRLSAPEGEPAVGVTPPGESERRDLTHLTALAIDDEGNRDPDDAISFDGEWLWVHIADAAAMAPPASELDLAARERGATLYLPEGVRPMLPEAAIDHLGLGLASESPALSFGVKIAEDGTLEDVTVTPSRVRVTRLTYAEAENHLDEEPLASIRRVTDAFRARRIAEGAAIIRIPEVSVKVRDGRVELRPLPDHVSRQIVTEAMLATGEAAARFAGNEGIAFPYSTQPPPEERPEGEDLASQFAFRRQMRPARLRSAPDHHAGVGLAAYTQVTSPMRRYLDLVAHQQLRAHLAGVETLDQEALLERVAAVDAVMGGLRRSERLSNQHWKLVWLKQQGQWEGEGIVVETGERKGRVFLPDLAYEAVLPLPSGTALNDRLTLRNTGVDIPALEARFSVR